MQHCQLQHAYAFYDAYIQPRESLEFNQRDDAGFTVILTS